MKEKLLAALRLKYPGMQAQMLGFFADKLAQTITAEDQIDGGITALEDGTIKPSDFATFAQQEGDRRVNDGIRTHENTLKTKFDFVEKGKTPPTPPDPNNPAPPVNPEMAALVKRLDMLEKEKQTAALSTKLQNILKEKKIPTFIAQGRTFETEDELNTYVTEIETAWTEHAQKEVNETLGGQTKPPGSEGYKGNVDSDISAWAKAKAPETV